MSLKTLIQSFQSQVKAKVEQKTRSTTSPQTTLVKCFKYFDLNSNGFVECDQFRKAVEKLGVTFDFTQLNQLFKYYDKDGNGTLDYKQFSLILYGGTPASQSSTAFKPAPTAGPFASNNARSVEDLIQLLRAKIKQRGANGLIGLQRLFKIMDDDGSYSLNRFQFTKALREYRLDLPQEDALSIFQAFDREGDGSINYDEFVRTIKGQMNAKRQDLVRKVFQKLDKDRSGMLDFNDIRNVYNAKKHPDVIQGKKTEQDVLREFLTTFQSHHCVIQQKSPDSKITLDQFIEYYNNISSSIDSDQYFTLMMNNAWKLVEPPQFANKPAWSGEYHSTASSPQKQQQYQHSKFPAPVSSIYQTSSHMSEDQKQQYDMYQAAVAQRPKYQTILLERFRSKLISRGNRGIIGLKRQFKLLDLDMSGKLSEQQFAKAIQDLRLEFVNQDIKTLFRIFDRNGDGTIDSQQFLNQVLGQLSGIRRDVIQKVFAKLDPYQYGSISMSTIRNQFDPSRHPDCKTGKKSPEQILGQFLQSFQSHHLVTNAYNSSSSSYSQSSDQITYPAFEEYFKFISAGIANDAQFDVLMTNIWNLDMKNNADARPFAGSKQQVYNVSSKQAWLRDHHRSIFSNDNDTVKHAPFGVGASASVNVSEDWVTQQHLALDSGLQPTSSYLHQSPAGVATWPNIDSSSVKENNGRSSMANIGAMTRFRASLLQRGLRGVIGLRRVFKILDDQDCGLLPYDLFKKGLIDYRLQINQQDSRQLFSTATKRGKDDLIQYQSFINQAIVMKQCSINNQGRMDHNRKILVQQIFDVIDGSGSRQVTVQDLKGFFNPQNHPDIKIGKKTQQQVLAEFIDTFEMHYGLLHPGSKSRRVTLNEFQDYYECVSALNEDDEYFYQIVQSAWAPPQSASSALHLYS